MPSTTLPALHRLRQLWRQLMGPPARHALWHAARVRLLKPMQPLPAERQQLSAGQSASRWCQSDSALWVADGSVRLHLPPGDGLTLAGPLVLHTGQSLVLPRSGWVRVDAPHGARLHWLPPI